MTRSSTSSWIETGSPTTSTCSTTSCVSGRTTTITTSARGARRSNPASVRRIGRPAQPSRTTRSDFLLADRPALPDRAYPEQGPENLAQGARARRRPHPVRPSVLNVQPHRHGGEARKPVILLPKDDNRQAPDESSPGRSATPGRATAAGVGQPARPFPVPLNSAQPPLVSSRQRSRPGGARHVYKPARRSRHQRLR